MSPKIFSCIGLGPNSSAIRTPSQFSAGCGAFQRRSPTGAFAKGTPLNTFTPEQSTPWRSPCATCTVGGSRDTTLGLTASVLVSLFEQETATVITAILANFENIFFMMIRILY